MTGGGANDRARLLVDSSLPPQPTSHRLAIEEVRKDALEMTLQASLRHVVDASYCIHQDNQVFLSRAHDALHRDGEHVSVVARRLSGMTSDSLDGELRYYGS
jgi:hypothetical protein